jgi:arylamine N-acetyltransferase
MMIKKIRLLPASETAYVLRRALGPRKAWEFWLADVRRGKAGACVGPILLPCGRVKDPAFGGFRPVYAIDDIKAFIIEFRAANPGSKAEISPTVYTAETDTGDMRHWKARKLKATKPSAYAHSSSTMSVPYRQSAMLVPVTVCTL